jgi:hypothetical protein
MEKVMSVNEIKRKTHVIQVLDESGSMDFGKKITIDQFNDQLGILYRMYEEAGEDITVTLIKFSTNPDVVFKARSIADYDSMVMTDRSYMPGGQTALYDSIAHAITLANSLPDNGNTAYLLQILTDGQENSSRNHSASNIKQMIDQLNAKENWTVTVSGPTGSESFYRSINIPSGNITTYNPNSLGEKGYNGLIMTRSTRNYMDARMNGVSKVENAYSEFQTDWKAKAAEAAKTNAASWGIDNQSK